MPAATSTRVADRRERTRAEILAAAWDLARDQGIAGLSLRDLAARVGLRAPSLYGYFASKDAIYDAMFEQGWRELDRELAAVTWPDDPLEALQRGARAVFDLVRSDWTRYQLLFTRVVPGWSPSPTAYEAAVATYDRMVRELARIGVADPAAVDLYTAIVSGLLAQQFANDPEGDRYVRLTDDAMRMFHAHLTREEPT